MEEEKLSEWVREYFPKNRRDSIFSSNQAALSTREGRKYARRVGVVGRQLTNRIMHVRTALLGYEQLQDLAHVIAPAYVAAAEAHFLDPRKDERYFYIQHPVGAFYNVWEAIAKSGEINDEWIRSQMRIAYRHPEFSRRIWRMSAIAGTMALVHDVPEEVGKKRGGTTLESLVDATLARVHELGGLRPSGLSRRVLSLVTPTEGLAFCEEIDHIRRERSRTALAYALLVKTSDRGHNSEGNLGTFETQGLVANGFKNEYVACAALEFLEDVASRLRSPLNVLRTRLPFDAGGLMLPPWYLPLQHSSMILLTRASIEAQNAMANVRMKISEYARGMFDEDNAGMGETSFIRVAYQALMSIDDIARRNPAGEYMRQEGTGRSRAEREATLVRMSGSALEQGSWRKDKDTAHILYGSFHAMNMASIGKMRKPDQGVRLSPESQLALFVQDYADAALLAREFSSMIADPTRYVHGLRYVPMQNI